MKVITSEYSITNYQNVLFNQLDSFNHIVIPCIISWQAQPFKAEVHWSNELEMWWYSKITDDKWLNCYGINKPFQGDKIKISCEFNIPTKGINRGVVGCFVADEKQIYLAHRGNRWGSGKRGLNKDYFWAKFEGQSHKVEDGEISSKVAVICRLGSTNLPHELSFFIHWIVKIKSS